jgi:predicted nucleic acid-binding protein
MGVVLFDTTAYIDSYRSGDEALLYVRRLPSGDLVWLSAVVLAELNAGATEESLGTLKKLEYDFQTSGRLLVPNLGDWVSAGEALAYLRDTFDYEATGRARLMNDALIAMSAARMGMTVVTYNERDFARLAKFRHFSWRLNAP